MGHSNTKNINCSICNKPVNLETAKTDDNGKAVHAECYVLAVIAKQQASGNQQPRILSHLLGK